MNGTTAKNLPMVYVWVLIAKNVVLPIYLSVEANEKDDDAPFFTEQKLSQRKRIKSKRWNGVCEHDQSFQRILIQFQAFTCLCVCFYYVPNR